MSRRAERIEQQLGGLYRLGRLLGAGGMGEVWAAREVELDRAVAIKILGTALSSDAAFVERFRREAKTLAKFSHPRIVRVLNIGTLAWDAREYMVMEQLAGQTLRARIDELGREGRVLDPVSAAFFAVQMLDGLGVAHEEGIIHRDVKPENVMIDAQGHLTLLDFGLAKLAVTISVWLVLSLAAARSTETTAPASTGAATPTVTPTVIVPEPAAPPAETAATAATASAPRPAATTAPRPPRLSPRPASPPRRPPLIFPGTPESTRP